MLLTSIRLAIRGLNRNKLRTMLTMLGMIIGVAAVMTMVALGNGAQQSVEQEVRSAGTSLIHVNAGNYTRGGEESKIASGLGSATTLTPGDAEAVGPRRLRHQGPGARRQAARMDCLRRRAGTTDRCSAPMCRSRRCSAGASSRDASSRPPTSPRAVRWRCWAARRAIRFSAPAPTPSGRPSRFTDSPSPSSASPTRPIRIRSRWRSCRTPRCRTRSASRTCTRSRSKRCRPATRRALRPTWRRCCGRGTRSTSTRRCRGCARAA